MIKYYFNFCIEFIILCFLCFSICGCQQGLIYSEEEVVSHFYSGDVLVTIAEVTPYQTKSSMSDVRYYTVSGLKNTSEYSLFVEVEDENNGFFINKVYSQEQDLLFSEVIYNKQLISRDFEDLPERYDIDTNASRHKNEKYLDCVHRVHAKLKERLNTNYPVTCEFISCGAISAVCAIVECAEYGYDH